MNSLASSCRECDHGSYRCDGCRRAYCHVHFLQHQQTLNEQFDNITLECSNLKQILTLPPSYASLAEDTDLINKIDQWENETIRQIKRISEAAKEKIHHRSDTTPASRFEPELEQFSEELHQTQQTNHILESDIQRLMIKLNDLKVKIQDCLMTTAEIKINPIDWTKYFQLVIKQQPMRRIQHNLHLDRLLTARPRISVDVRGADWHILGKPSLIKSTFLHYQHTKKNKRLSTVNVDGQQKLIPWYEDQSIWDSCWSSFLNKFIILADNRLYIYDDDIVTSDSMQVIETVKPKRDRMEFLRCACSDETVYITYDERNSSIDQYNMNSWIISHQYENIVKQSEIIISIAISETNSNLIGLTILDERHNWHFELRDRSMQLISSVHLDNSEFNRRLVSLSNSSMNWLIVHTGSAYFTVLDENAQTKRMIQCSENIDLATYFATKNCLVLLTQKSQLKYFDL